MGNENKNFGGDNRTFAATYLLLQETLSKFELF